jgi:hypothetical protein
VGILRNKKLKMKNEKGNTGKLEMEIKNEE